MEATLTDASAAVNDAPCVRRDCDWPGRWKDLHTYLERPGPMQGDGFESGNNVKAFLHACKILVIGAGGLGCELLKNLALSGFTDIHLIDMDTIDVSNLNRQFLFRRTDIGKSKAIVAAEFIMRRIPGVLVTPYYGKIQDKDETYYSQFSIIICGLDSVEARRWINATIVGMFDQDIPETLKPIIDGGTEGFKGQSRVILPRITACYECSLDMQTKPVTFPMCTIANTPRLPEHCIEWASSVAWPKEFPDKRVDGDDPEHIRWLQTIASERACEFSITGVTYTLTQGVVKNIIPAIASTNAIVAASCANEAFKIATNCATYMNNYMMYTGDQGVYSYTFELQQKEDCPVCGSAELSLAISGDKTLADLIDMLLETQEMQGGWHTFFYTAFSFLTLFVTFYSQLKSPSLRTATSSLYMQAPKMLREATLPNLQRKLKDLISPGELITVTDALLPISLELKLQL